jgi:hypothetical protein
MPGSGGNFLCHLIVSAKKNNRERILLSHYGNAHSHGLKDIKPKSLYSSFNDDDVVNSLLAQKANITIKKPYYTPVHIFDIHVVNNTFKKSIRITYDMDDIEEISTTFYGKWFRLHSDNIKLEKNLSIDILKANTIKVLPLFKKEDNMPNILFISWKDLFRTNIDNLISKLSIFTDINTNNFFKESIIHWRNKTQYCIDTFK